MKPLYPLNRRLGWTQGRSGRGSEEINFHPLSGIEPPIIQPVAQNYTILYYNNPPDLELWEKLKTPHLKKKYLLQNVTNIRGLGGIF
jgi:hypothetical protein